MYSSIIIIIKKVTYSLTRNKCLMTSPYHGWKKGFTSRQRVHVNTDCYKGFTDSLLMQAVLIRL